MKIILPKTLYDCTNINAPLFFLVGPIKGGDDWQSNCCKELQKRIENFYVVIPCRYGISHPLYEFRVSGDENRFPSQTLWERYYLDLSAKLGCIIAWLPCESKIAPRNDGQPYARDTYGELGEWRGRLIFDNSINFVIGAEPNFPGLSQISRNFSDALKTEFHICETLEETVENAVQKTKR